MQADVERFLARILVDRELRERFLCDPAAVARGHGLSETESAALAAIEADDLRTAGRSFERKRNRRPKPRMPARVVSKVRRLLEAFSARVAGLR
jgi:hypothetical protein